MQIYDDGSPLYLSLKLSILSGTSGFIHIMKLFVDSTAVGERIKVCKFPFY